MGKENSKYFFRQDEIDTEVGLVENVPPDLEWAVKAKKVVVPTLNTVYRLDGSEPNYGDQVFVPQEPKPEVPRVLGIKRQQVYQDPQGTSLVSVTFDVSNIDNVEYEIRITQ
ncbi:hypothetical protein FDI69_gp084 [Rhodococcus phage Trina]|uniref:Uncharacterized protein n=1 Tax=Rhodococcus phage Trina TaxID=2027905 RepID=A0A2D0ZNG4_9CAUD|nr:hypothetical protein FDI69_gp084 [Rhodococcus phage Trina]ASZ74898.1 hypothetical protein SEA_TRINA_84 [Rhodococcus phage Trina]